MTYQVHASVRRKWQFVEVEDLDRALILVSACKAHGWPAYVQLVRA